MVQEVQVQIEYDLEVVESGAPDLNKVLLSLSVISECLSEDVGHFSIANPVNLHRFS